MMFDYTRQLDITKTLKQVETIFWWPSLRDDVKSSMNSYDVCQCSKVFSARIAYLLQSLEIPEKKSKCTNLILSLA